MATWCSKLGNEYPQEEIEKNGEKYKTELDRLRQLPSNRFCADCGSNGTSWASINLGVFLCSKCGEHHCSVGPLSEPKNCTGSELWGPDEVEHMDSLGNAAANAVYGGDESRPAPNASDEDWKKFLTDKYEHRRYAPQSLTVSQPLLQNRFDEEEMAFFNNKLDGNIQEVESGKGEKDDEFFAQFGM